jgi:hypothetical protein
MIKILSEGITTLNVYVPISRASKYTKQKLPELNKDIDKLIIIVGAFIMCFQSSQYKNIDKT